MANVQYYDVILKPVITEKSMNAMGDKKYTFFVHPEATKTQIKEAVEKMFEGTIPLCLLAAYVSKWGIVGVYTLLTTEELFRLAVSLIIFRRRKWIISFC